MDNEELKFLRESIKNLNIDDIESVRDWAWDHKELSRSDMAIVLGVSISRMTKIVSTYGISNMYFAEYGSKMMICSKKIPNRFVRKPKKYNGNIPHDWKTNYEWLKQVYEIDQHTMDSLSKSIGCERETFKKTLIRNGIKVRKINEVLSNNKYENECYSKEWIMDNYYDKKLSITACCKLANISPNIFRIWLSDFEISTRKS